MAEIASFAQTTGLKIVVYAPLPLTTGLDDIAPYVESYSHELHADGGFYSAQVRLRTQRYIIDEWLARGLGRRIVVYNPGGSIVFEGFVNTISASTGTNTTTRGPLLSSTNRARLVYSSIDTSITPPAMGVRRVTATYNDTAAQTKYGIIEKVLSSGGCTDANAIIAVNTFLTDNAEPETSESISLGRQDVNLSLDILGYYAWLGSYVYNSSTTGTQTISAKLQAVLAANPNSTMFSADYGGITTNATTIGAWENDDRLAADVIKGIVAMGNSGYERHTLGMYADRKVIYAPVPSTRTYLLKSSGQAQEVQLIADQSHVDPWDVRPARWVFEPDILTASPSFATDLRSEPRNKFIETVRYSAPNGLEINGSKVNTLPQVLASLGLSGIGA